MKLVFQIIGVSVVFSHAILSPREKISFRFWRFLVIKVSSDSEASLHLSKLAEMASQRLSERAASLTRHFFQRLSVILQRAKASLMATRAPPLPSPHILGH